MISQERLTQLNNKATKTICTYWFSIKGEWEIQWLEVLTNFPWPDNFNSFYRDRPTTAREKQKGHGGGGNMVYHVTYAPHATTDLACVKVVWYKATILPGKIRINLIHDNSYNTSN